MCTVPCVILFDNDFWCKLALAFTKTIWTPYLDASDTVFVILKNILFVVLSVLSVVCCGVID
jgi:hypothetical protein